MVFPIFPWFSLVFPMVFFHVDTVGVLKMIDTLSSDIEKEMAVATSEEKNAQADYEETIKARRPHRVLRWRRNSHNNNVLRCVVVVGFFLVNGEVVISNIQLVIL